ncbi:TKL protein kinase [Saprolegnia parasitica CBS 223.65]|uniref:TKL protein kinase n=1 Tax=Saprolegnia parasitica (strain CBS 223.65) TaxID=695850 RepID=A0A067BK64_SAPPC|nr:TKL protein kinase [Saprolegnia parasitica CBS 223.65]KDO18849.1 TKL protein kinase [Saprolegnia parasitica CBS 223.65]|eukprot:XP_012210432.1 TKL protein kinase [Saprolegnia parasitica CBS 223.65]
MGDRVLTTQCGGAKNVVVCLVDANDRQVNLVPSANGSLTVKEPFKILDALSPRVAAYTLDDDGVRRVNPSLGDSVPSSAQLASLSLQGNVLDGALNMVQWPPSLATLDLSGNRIGFVNASFVIPSKLRTLNLSRNKITSIDRLRIPPTLRALWLADNPITTFNVDAASFTSLSEMSLLADEPIVVTSCHGQLRTFKGAPDAETQRALVHSVCVVYDDAIPIDTSMAGGDTSSGRGEEAPVGMYVGIGIGVGVLLALIGFLLCRRRCRGSSGEKPYHSLETPPLDATARGSSFERHHNQQEHDIIASSTGSGSTSSAFSYDLRSDIDLDAARIPKKELLHKRVCGSGGFAVVYKATFQAQIVAVKELQAVHARQSIYIQAFMHEIKMFSTLNHDNIVAFVGVSWTTLHDLALITEFLPNGDLRELLSRDATAQALHWTATSDTFPVSKLQMAVNVIDAITYLHSFEPKILHRDLKSRNILLDGYYAAKLTDFGISRSMIDETMTMGTGTTAWAAPEVLLHDGHYNEKADVYSFGVVLSELDTWHVPYAAASSSQPMSSVQMALLVSTGKLTPTFRDDCPPPVRALAEQCLAMDPTGRPTASQAAYELRRYMRSLPSGLAS